MFCACSLRVDSMELHVEKHTFFEIINDLITFFRRINTEIQNSQYNRTKPSEHARVLFSCTMLASFIVPALCVRVCFFR